MVQAKPASTFQPTLCLSLCLPPTNQPTNQPQVEEQWYEVQDLRVTEVLPQMVALSETYLQVYELKPEDKL